MLSYLHTFILLEQRGKPAGLKLKKKMKGTQPLMGGVMTSEKGVSIFYCVLAAVHSIGAATESGEIHILL